MSDQTLDLLHLALEYLLPLLATAASIYLLPKLDKYIKAKTDGPIEALLLRVREHATTSVLATNQVFVDKLKEGRAPGSPGGRRLTPEEAREARLAAKRRLKRSLGLDALEKLKDSLGGSENVEDLLDSEVEAAVRATKRP